jgi:hypothetical protein
MEPRTSTTLSGQITPDFYHEITVNTKNKKASEKTESIAVIIKEKIEMSNRKEQLYSFLQRE